MFGYYCHLQSHKFDFQYRKEFNFTLILLPEKATEENFKFDLVGMSLALAVLQRKGDT